MGITSNVFQVFYKRYCTIIDGKIMDKFNSPCIILGKKWEGTLSENLYEVLCLDLGFLILVILWSILWASVLLVNDSHIEVKIISIVFSTYPIISNALDWLLVWKKVKKSFND